MDSAEGAIDEEEGGKEQEGRGQRQGVEVQVDGKKILLCSSRSQSVVRHGTPVV